MIAAAVDNRPSFDIIKNKGQRKNGRPRKETLTFTSFDHIRRHQAALLAGHMLLDNIEIGAIRFMLKVYPLFLEQRQAGGKEMAAACNITPQAAVKHIKNLTDAGYLNRIHYRAWEISDSYLTQLNRM